MAGTANPAPARRSRFWLFAPLLVVVAVGWSIAWAVLRQRTADGLDAWLADEAAAGRQWTCADRSVGGYPFRLEVSCRTLTFRRGEATAEFGSLLTVAQVDRPGHVALGALLGPPPFGPPLFGAPPFGPPAMGPPETGGGAPDRTELTPLMPVRLENGRVSFGPFVLPAIRLPPLY